MPHVLKRTNDCITHDEIVDDFTASWNLISGDAERILDPGELPPRLELCAKALRKGYFWRAWKDAGQLRFVVMNLTRDGCSRMEESLSMEAYFFDQSAKMVSAGSWNRVHPGRWRLSDRFERPAAKWRYARLRPLLKSNIQFRRKRKFR